MVRYAGLAAVAHAMGRSDVVVCYCDGCCEGASLWRCCIFDLIRIFAFTGLGS